MFRNIYAVLVSFFLFTFGALAYGQDAQIQGQVLDPSGAGIAKAFIRVVDQQTGKEASTVTDENGQYTVPALTSGVFLVYVEAPGFSTAVSDPLKVTTGKSTVLDFTLKVGATSADVIVTAEKHQEDIRNTPVPVSVINPDQLTNSDEVLLRNYYMSVPGLDVSPNVNGITTLSLRGVTTGGYENSTVGVLVGEVPFMATMNGPLIPDIDPFDLERIEVLRGPQGTLYGANSMGGLIKFVTKDPSPERIVGRIETGTSVVHNGAEAGYKLRAGANIPLSHTAAFRASGYSRQDPGYIDNVLTNQKGINKTEANGAMISTLWHPSDAFSAKLSALYQYTKADGVAEVVKAPGLGDLQQNYVGNLPSRRTIQAYNATLDYRVKTVDMSSITGYSGNSINADLDGSFIWGQQALSMFGVSGAASQSHFPTHKWTQELRVSTPIGEHLEWLVGGFYTHENNPNYQNVAAVVPTTGQVVGELGFLYEHNTYQELAAFTDFTYHFTNRFNIQVGGRESQYKVYQPATYYTGIFDSTLASEQSKASAFNYLVTPQYTVSPNLMVYARFASGFRPGGPNSPVTVAAGAPLAQNPDRTENYEAGLKGDFFHHLIFVDTSLYYIDWHNIQLQLVEGANGFDYGGNGGAAKSEGVELTVESKPRSGLSITGWVDYDDAALTQALPSSSTVVGASGSRLPNSSRFSGNLSFEQDGKLRKDVTGFIGGSFSYVGDRWSVFQSTPERQYFPSYTKTDLRVGAKYNLWSASAFATNVGDVRGLLNGGLGYYTPDAYIYIQPRAVGLSLVKTF